MVAGLAWISASVLMGASFAQEPSYGLLVTKDKTLAEAWQMDWKSDRVRQLLGKKAISTRVNNLISITVASDVVEPSGLALLREQLETGGLGMVLLAEVDKQTSVKLRKLLEYSPLVGKSAQQVGAMAFSCEAKAELITPQGRIAFRSQLMEVPEMPKSREEDGDPEFATSAVTFVMNRRGLGSLEEFKLIETATKSLIDRYSTLKEELDVDAERFYDRNRDRMFGKDTNPNVEGRYRDQFRQAFIQNSLTHGFVNTEQAEAAFNSGKVEIRQKLVFLVTRTGNTYQQASIRTLRF